MEGSLNYRGTAASPFLLTTLLFSGFIISQAQGVPRDVNGVVGGSVLLSIIIPNGLSVLEVRWKSVTNNARLGDFKGRAFEPFHLASPTITQRLDMENATTLRISNLAKNDSGIYRAEVQYESGFNEEKEFQLKVYDPVPVPHIEKESLSTTSEGCNVTLVCQFSTEYDLNLLWIKRDAKDSTRYQNISAGQKLQLSLSANLSDSEYFCLVSNPVDQKNASISSVCPRGSPPESRVLGYFLIPVALIVLSILGLFIYLYMKKKKKKRLDEADKSVYFLAGTEEGQPLTTFASIPRRPPDGNDEVRCDMEDHHMNLQDENITATTVYQKIQPHPKYTPLEVSKMEVRCDMEDHHMNLQDENITATTVYQKIQPHPKYTPLEASKMEVRYDYLMNLQEENLTATTVYQKIQPHPKCTTDEVNRMEVY